MTNKELRVEVGVAPAQLRQLFLASNLSDQSDSRCGLHFAVDATFLLAANSKIIATYPDATLVTQNSF